MKLGPEVIRFLEAQTLFTLIEAQLKTKAAEAHRAEGDLKLAFDALTPAEKRMVRDACDALDWPEMYRAI